VSEAHARLSETLSTTKCGSGPTPAYLTGHDVQFYRTDAYLARSVVEFLSVGLRAGQPIVVVATEQHRQDFAEGLRAKGVDPDELYSGRLAIWLDARETLASFMEGPTPNRELFMATVGNVFERVLNKRYYLVVRGYGEMVDLLYKDGNCEGAVGVEALWNELSERYKYSLLCGYSVDNFLQEPAVDGFRRICNHHTHALPLEPMDGQAA
jgi:hypothetical protein